MRLQELVLNGDNSRYVKRHLVNANKGWFCDISRNMYQEEEFVDTKKLCGMMMIVTLFSQSTRKNHKASVLKYLVFI